MNPIQHFLGVVPQPFYTGSLAVLLEIGTPPPDTTQAEWLAGAGPGLLSAEFRPEYNGGEAGSRFHEKSGERCELGRANHR